LNEIKKPPRKQQKAPVNKKNSWSNILNKEISLFQNKRSNKKKEAFYSELSVLLASGMDIKSSLEIIAEQQKKEKDQQFYENILNEVVKGRTLSEALQDTGTISLYEYHSLRIGEESGRIKEILADLTNYFNKKIQQRKKITGIITYPVLVLVTAVLAVAFMLTFIVPMFTDVFNRFGGELPGLTKTIIKLSDFFSDYFWLFLLVVGILITFLILVRKHPLYRRISSALLLKMPFIGKVAVKIYLNRFCHTMALLTASKTPLLRSVQLVKQMIGSYTFEKALTDIESDILHGKSLHVSMSRFSVFDKKTTSLVRVGEEINRLDEIFQKLSNQYSEELDYQMGMLSNLLEPIMILLVGLLVAVILIAMYLPLFQLSTSFY